MKKTSKIVLYIGVNLLLIFLFFYHNYQFWTHYKTDNFEALTEYNGKNIKGLRGRQILVHKDFKKHLNQIDKYAIENNIELIVNQSYRSDKQTLSRTIVEPGKLSNHLAGFAIDFNIKSNGVKYFANDLKKKKLGELPQNVQDFINDIRNNKDLRWGGDFRKEDPIHIDSPINLKNEKSWVKCSNDCDSDYSNRIPKWKFWR